MQEPVEQVTSASPVQPLAWPDIRHLCVMAIKDFFKEKIDILPDTGVVGRIDMRHSDFPSQMMLKGLNDVDNAVTLINKTSALICLFQDPNGALIRTSYLNNPERLRHYTIYCKPNPAAGLRSSIDLCIEHSGLNETIRCDLDACLHAEEGVFRLNSESIGQHIQATQTKLEVKRAAIDAERAAYLERQAISEAQRVAWMQQHGAEIAARSVADASARVLSCSAGRVVSECLPIGPEQIRQLTQQCSPETDLGPDEEEDFAAAAGARQAFFSQPAVADMSAKPVENAQGDKAASLKLDFSSPQPRV